MPMLKARIDGRPPGAPAIASPKGSRVHDLRHTYASLSRRAGADLRLLQKAMGHASITVTAHTYADLFDDELDDIASALDSLDDLQSCNIGA
jgi:integrase